MTYSSEDAIVGVEHDAQRNEQAEDEDDVDVAGVARLRALPDYASGNSRSLQGVCVPAQEGKERPEQASDVAHHWGGKGGGRG